ncbi:MAG: imelysin family protein, partial [Pseudomonadota bacterium]
DAAQASCAPDDPALRAAFNETFDAWMGVSHLRFGPAEESGAAFTLAFWPDTRGAISKAILRLVSSEDPVIRDQQAFGDVSAAARGFFALEQLLYEPSIMAAEPESARCNLVRAVAADIHDLAHGLQDDWAVFRTALEQPSAEGRFQSDQEAAQIFYKSLSEGLQFTHETRLGRPMGTFDRPRPNRAEARRSERSLRQVQLSIAALEELTLILAKDQPMEADLVAAFTRAKEAADIDDPAFAGVADPIGRLRVEAIATALRDVRAIVALELAPTLGVSAGFNSLDGD